ncbi:glycoside hydrolase family 2 TIM barrel-domain containing protein [Flavobacteriaceae bacterium S356]|uniref:Glycoside hydrolase family 2 TIM barrel-domain containing protein n=1 Tax=Asprobacillus argus TaxID=3076534 RepID=A0ABU3LAR3_9FLAO|nr:glycoside hydrolase family 2 TIM barrel-domain containing protein [Flavobacteriaceae bacterium S356]
MSLGLFSQTAVKKTDKGWHLLVDGQPFDVKGATFGYENDVENYDTYFKDLQFLGVNTIRTWATGKNAKKLLDAAHAHGIKVMMGIWMRHGRPGMEDDDSFNYLEDEDGKKAMYANAISVVKQYKDHPAVLTWGIGNEVYLNMTTNPEKEAYSKLLERICSEIKKIDANHPITSVEAWTFGLEWWQKYVPSLDIYGLNSYGPGAGYLQAELDKKNIDKPYILTEFGVTGEWDIKQEKNGVKVEPSDQQKYNAIAKGYQNWIKNKPSCLGVYVFHYSSGNDFASPWLLMRHRDMNRPQYWATREAYTGKKPVNNVPVIKKFELSTSEAKSKTWISVSLEVNDSENDNFEVSFYYNQRTGSRKRRNQVLPLAFNGNYKDGFKIQLPQEDGPVKVYVNVKDSYNNVGIASTGIIVKDKKAKKKKYLVPKATLPFYIYKENKDLPYAASGYMGNYKKLSVDLDYKDDVHSGKTSIKIGYPERGGWYGIAFQDPANDWGSILGGYNIEGAKTFSFWAKANAWNVKATVGFGLIDQDKPFPDTAKKSIPIVIDKAWKKYTIKIKREDLSCIRSGFVLFSNGNGTPHEIYIDDIVFE